DPGRTGVCTVVVTLISPHDRSIVPIPVYPPGAAHRANQLITGTVAVKRVENAAIGSDEHPRTAGIIAVVVIPGSAHDQVIVTIPVHIPRAADGTAQIIRGTIGRTHV